MLASIDLDHEVRLEAGEIRDIRRDRDLAAKAKTRYLLSAQPHPKALLGVGHRSSKPSGPLNIGARRDRHVSHCNRAPTLPSPASGGGRQHAPTLTLPRKRGREVTCPHPDPPPQAGEGDDCATGEGRRLRNAGGGSEAPTLPSPVNGGGNLKPLRPGVYSRGRRAGEPPS